MRLKCPESQFITRSIYVLNNKTNDVMQILKKYDYELILFHIYKSSSDKNIYNIYTFEDTGQETYDNHIRLIRKNA